MNLHSKRVLLLNADYSPLSIIGWRRAISLNIVGDVTIVDFYENEHIEDSRGRHYPIPSIVSTNKYVRKTSKTIAFSRKNVFIRDKLTCQYCGKIGKPEELTYDHVIPRVKWNKEKYGTPTHWENIVTACYKCNNKKAAHTLKEAGMSLLKEPKKPSPGQYILGLSPWNDKIPECWKVYLPPLYRGELSHNVT